MAFKQLHCLSFAVLFCIYFGAVVSKKTKCNNIQCSLHEEPNNNCTACICTENYIDRSSLGCVPCNRCKKPFVSIKKCNALTKENTKCGACPKGTYYRDNYCSNCSHCGEGIAIEMPCGVSDDIICGQKSHNGTHTKQHITTRERKEEYKYHTLYMYLFWTLVAVNLVSIIICVLVKLRARRERNMAQCSAESSNLLESASASSLGTMNDLTIEERSRLVRNFSGSFCLTLGKLLNPTIPRDNWVALAGVLGYTPNEIENIKVEANASQSGYTEVLLCSWGTQNKATVGALGKALNEIKRDDAFALLNNFLLKSRELKDREERHSSIV